MLPVRLSHPIETSFLSRCLCCIWHWTALRPLADALLENKWCKQVCRAKKSLRSFSTEGAPVKSWPYALAMTSLMTWHDKIVWYILSWLELRYYRIVSHLSLGITRWPSLYTSKPSLKGCNIWYFKVKANLPNLSDLQAHRDALASSFTLYPHHNVSKFNSKMKLNLALHL